MMLSKAVILVCVVCLGGLGWATVYDESHTLSDEFIAQINREQRLWKAGRNFHEKSSLKHLLSMLPEHDIVLPTRDGDVQVKSDLPNSFDCRTKWKQCKSIGAVADQGNCAAGWAIAPSSVLSDRLCVAGGAQVNVSSQHVLSCCKKCGTGCFGGYVKKSLEYLQNHGTPTGSFVGRKGCQPYAVRMCNSVGSTPYCSRVRDPTPLCASFRCTNRVYKNDFGKDFYKAAQVYSVPNNVTEIRDEIYRNGPVLAVLDVFQDLFSYKYGVYRHVLGGRMGQQEVKIIGWGVEKNTQYWIAVNSWGTKWGTRGVLKIAAGANECNVEARVVALRPKI